MERTIELGKERNWVYPSGSVGGSESLGACCSRGEEGGGTEAGVWDESETKGGEEGEGCELDSFCPSFRQFSFASLQPANGQKEIELGDGREAY